MESLLDVCWNGGPHVGVNPEQFRRRLQSRQLCNRISAITALDHEARVPIDTRQSDFSEMDNVGISKGHWKIMFISGMGFFTDAYDLFIIGAVMALQKPLWHVGNVEEGLVESTALLASAIGALLFGRIADNGRIAAA